MPPAPYSLPGTMTAAARRDVVTWELWTWGLSGQIPVQDGGIGSGGNGGIGSILGMAIPMHGVARIARCPDPCPDSHPIHPGESCVQLGDDASKCNIPARDLADWRRGTTGARVATSRRSWGGRHSARGWSEGALLRAALPLPVELLNLFDACRAPESRRGLHQFPHIE
jgi:hypothetical protein